MVNCFFSTFRNVAWKDNVDNLTVFFVFGFISIGYMSIVLWWVLLYPISKPWSFFIWVILKNKHGITRPYTHIIHVYPPPQRKDTFPLPLPLHKKEKNEQPQLSHGKGDIGQFVFKLPFTMTDGEWAFVLQKQFFF